ncbi:hypothetical protein DPMN_056252 [Dreissena polymorpha]|uniref:Uncharacterized protein n=1 Tax=Dreissena polymorpha TaxID=45954 RepID=A0A9D4HT02_DREPO|nr:hypothetical protein DPMN_056252 [Dreissena polymorpha]
MSESELMNAADGSLLDISLEELCTSKRFSCGICEASYARKAYTILIQFLTTFGKYWMNTT